MFAKVNPKGAKKKHIKITSSCENVSWIETIGMKGENNPLITNYCIKISSNKRGNTSLCSSSFGNFWPDWSDSKDFSMKILISVTYIETTCVHRFLHSNFLKIFGDIMINSPALSLSTCCVLLISMILYNMRIRLNLYFVSLYETKANRQTSVLKTISSTETSHSKNDDGWCRIKLNRLTNNLTKICFVYYCVRSSASSHLRRWLSHPWTVMFVVPYFRFPASIIIIIMIIIIATTIMNTKKNTQWNLMEYRSSCAGRVDFNWLLRSIRWSLNNIKPHHTLSLLHQSTNSIQFHEWCSLLWWRSPLWVGKVFHRRYQSFSGSETDTTT